MSHTRTREKENEKPFAAEPSAVVYKDQDESMDFQSPDAATLGKECANRPVTPGGRSPASQLGTRPANRRRGGEEFGQTLTFPGIERQTRLLCEAASFPVWSCNLQCPGLISAPDAFPGAGRLKKRQNRLRASPDARIARAWRKLGSSAGPRAVVIVRIIQAAAPRALARKMPARSCEREEFHANGTRRGLGLTQHGSSLATEPRAAGSDRR